MFDYSLTESAIGQLMVVATPRRKTCCAECEGKEKGCADDTEKMSDEGMIELIMAIGDAMLAEEIKAKVATATTVKRGYG